jgi:hypothetical protein
MEWQILAFVGGAVVVYALVRLALILDAWARGRSDPPPEVIAQAQHRRYPLNVAGDFYVEDGACMACTAPTEEAPDLMAFTPDMHCYFKRQPATAQETEQAILAVVVSSCGQVKYGGCDPAILRRLG